MGNEAKKTLFTPGPWTMKRVPEGAHGKAGALVYFRLEADGATVSGTSVYVGKTDGATREIPAAECEANARLIAQAPAMWATLRDVLAVAASNDSQREFALQQVAEQARAILAAIEGSER